MHKNIFHNASLKLSGMYLLVIMLISLVFSINSYVSYAQETDRSIRRPLPQLVNRLSTTELQEVVLDRQEFLDTTKNEFRNRLIVLNLLILLSGGTLSYYFARRTLRPIEKAHEKQSRFTADASHELRTPITAMKTETEVALMDQKLSLVAAKKQLESNIEELDKLTILSDGLLQLARIDDGDISKEKVHIDSMIQNAIDRVLKKAELKKQSIVVTGDKNVVLLANTVALTEAIVTILDNAIKYSPTKSPIKISVSSSSKTCRISVHDKGPGIKASDQPYIFDRFYRADSARTNSSEQGYGIGLSIAKSVAEAHNGSLNVKSVEGKGSSFSLIVRQ